MSDPSNLPTALIFFILSLVLIAALFDLVQSRIPNSLVIWGLLVALPVRYHYFGLTGVWLGLGGFVVCLLVFLPLYIGKGLGAGDVKLMAAIGAFLDPQQALVALIFCIGAASCIGVGYLIAKGGLLSYLGRYGQMLKALLITGRLLYIPPVAGEVAAQRFPFAVAIAAGVFGFIYYYYPDFYPGLFVSVSQGSSA